MYDHMREHYEDAGTRYDYYSEGGFADPDIFPYDPEPCTLAQKIDWKLACLRVKINTAITNVVPYVIGRSLAGRIAYMLCDHLTKAGVRFILRYGKPRDFTPTEALEAKHIQIGPVELVYFLYWNNCIDIYINHKWYGDFDARGFDRCPF
jgi:hypothetical protein